ncbi:dimethylamine monooxygenase subunit DmmA family protein [Streptomyces sp. GESEQ-35]|uniref:dimethylamine monooxygenase subunit DmmA family protein n=1 Tax=Streptomyces sp. GESEQ-35 TaxID=2812657 RepID=UPI001B338D66|nr:dimethylamine monooxygenase subunit DmmA family protein [Streptomyces sp. GESEQ-35]
MGAQHTSVPRWPTVAPELDRTGRAYAVLTFGPAASVLAAAWQSALETLGRPVWSRHDEQATADCLAELRAQISAATVGWRLLLAGPQSEVLAAYSEAVRGGVLDAEITVVVTETEHRRVWCAHCESTTSAEVMLGAEVPCAGCGRSLFVYHHVSRLHAAHLGFMTDAEEVP